MTPNNLPDLSFSQNWNGAKLLCDIFPTFRMPNEKYQEGHIYNLKLKGEFLGRVQLVKIHRMQFARITDMVAFVDVGRPAAYLKSVLRRMYSKRSVDWENVTMYWLWFKHIDQEQKKDKAVEDRAAKLGVQASLFAPQKVGFRH